VSARYVIRPKADQDLDDQAYYLAIVASPEVGRCRALREREGAEEIKGREHYRPSLHWPDGILENVQGPAIISAWRRNALSSRLNSPFFIVGPALLNSILSTVALRSPKSGDKQ